MNGGAPSELGGAPTLFSESEYEETPSPERLKAARRRLAERPGPSWADWFYSSFLKVYVGLGLFVGDAILAAFWLGPPNPIGLTATLAPVLYLEFVLYQYLWKEPDRGGASRSTGAHRQTWLTPFAVGRWTPAGRRARQGLDPFPSGPQGPDPREFL